eukprot:1287140-Heterocapsa_arctica.AAC.1
MIASKTIGDVAAGIMEAIKAMGGKPKTIYADQEGAWTSIAILNYFKEQNIRFLMTQVHAPATERQIRTITKYGLRWNYRHASRVVGRDRTGPHNLQL